MATASLVEAGAFKSYFAANRTLETYPTGWYLQRQVRAYFDLGISHLIIALRRPGFYDKEGLRLFAREVMPAFR